MRSDQHERGHKAIKNEANLEVKGGLIRSNETKKELKIEQNDTTMMTEITGTIALRTICII